MRVFQSTSLDVLENLTIEEGLLGEFESDGPALLFYRNRSCLVWGKNQNPWREADLVLARAAGAALGRRLSGGGTVYHDEGNLNYALIVPRRDYRREVVLDRVVGALNRLGIPAGRQDTSLYAHGRKFSGSAFCFRGTSVLHHGTLLVDANLERLEATLRPPGWTMETSAVPSVRASVINLRQAHPAVTLSGLERALIDEFAPGADAMPIPPEAVSRWRSIHDRLATWEWVFGMTPRFSVALVNDVAGDKALSLVVAEGRVTEVNGHEAGRAVAAGLLERIPFDAGLIAGRLRIEGFDGLATVVAGMRF